MYKDHLFIKTQSEEMPHGDVPGQLKEVQCRMSRKKQQTGRRWAGP